MKNSKIEGLSVDTADCDAPAISEPVGRKRKPDTMWECYWLTNFAAADKPHLPQHKDLKGAYTVVGARLNLSPGAVEFHVTNARELLDTGVGTVEFTEWLAKNVYGPKGLSVALFDAGSLESNAERARRDAAGVKNRYSKAERARRK